MKKLYTLTALVLLASMVLTACGTAATTVAPPPPADTAAPMPWPP